MTLAQERAAIRAGVSSSRASSLKRDLNSLETSRRRTQELNTLERKGLRPATRGRGVWVEPAKTGGTGEGVAWPLTEQTKVEGLATVPDRTYYADLVITSSEGIFTWEIPPVHVLKFKDADNVADHQVILAEPKRT
ncbi:hypothetical protein [Pseudomonas sp. zfem005]|uniref:hypothetical protein n=1 Tax=Pseudomonas sp. zfem005 TaxID=3078200 RepID=UPI002927BB21|nr:hypothetical protein [Pseudomonas sp. zfem005]MDU9415577.1 hypothetical protein [Pseudomonas sp. zfem005]